MNTIVCPKCGKSLTVADPSRSFVFCQYCGTKININVNYNFSYSKSEHTERIIDEAKSKSADNVNRVINIFAEPIEKAREEARREEAEEAEEERRQKEAKRIRKEKIMNGQYSAKEAVIDFFQSDAKYLLLLGIMFLFSLGWLISAEHKSEVRKHQEELNAIKQEEIAASRLSMGQASIPEFSSDDDARTFAKNLKDHGFVNVTTEAVSGHKGKQYEIIEVVVDGAPDYNSNTWYPTDTDIIVRYCAEDNESPTLTGMLDKVTDFLS